MLNNSVQHNEIPTNESRAEILITTAHEIYTPDRRQEMIATAEKNSLGKHVRYYRLIGPGEAFSLMEGQQISPLTSPTIRADFEKNRTWLVETFSRYKNEFSEEYQALLPKILEALGTAPTLDQFMEISLHQIPRYDLFRLHVRQMQYVNNYYGVLSLSVGIPFLEPSGFRESEGKPKGSAVAELVIPNDEIFVFPPSGGLRETEKEVNTLIVKPEWVVDLYTSPVDFADRYIASADSPLKDDYKALLTQDSMLWLPSHAHDLLMDYKHNHNLEQLIPVSKLPFTDPSNPVQKQPLL